MKVIEQEKCKSDYGLRLFFLESFRSSKHAHTIKDKTNNLYTPMVRQLHTSTGGELQQNGINPFGFDKIQQSVKMFSIEHKLHFQIQI